MKGPVSLFWLLYFKLLFVKKSEMLIYSMWGPWTWLNSIISFWSSKRLSYNFKNGCFLTILSRAVFTRKANYHTFGDSLVGVVFHQKWYKLGFDALTMHFVYVDIRLYCLLFYMQHLFNNVLISLKNWRFLFVIPVRWEPCRKKMVCNLISFSSQILLIILWKW